MTDKTDSILSTHRDFLLHQYAIGWSSFRLARELGLYTARDQPDHAIILRALRRAGVTPRKPNINGRGYILRSQHADAIVEAHKAGMTVRALGRKYKVARVTIGRILRDKGCPIRLVENHKVYLSPEEISLVASGLPRTQTAKLIGMSLWTLRKREGHSGVPARDSKAFRAWCARQRREAPVPCP